MSPVLEEVSLAVGLLAALVVALEAGFREGRRAGPVKGSGSQVMSIQAAALGLLGLLLAFTFAAAGTRFLERQDLIVREANAIGTSVLRADVLGEPYGSELRAALDEYTEHRIALSANQKGAWDPAALVEIERMHARIWSAARAGVSARPEMALLVLPPINEVIDLHAIRVNAAIKHVPWLVLALLAACSLSAVAMIGYGCGLEGSRYLPMTLTLAFLIAGALWITIDLDHPRRGLLRLNDAALQALTFDAR